MTFVWATLYILAVLVFWTTNLIGLPGNWLIAGTTAAYVWLNRTPENGATGWWIVGVVIALAVFGEVVELAASSVGVKRAGGARRSSLLALVGSIVGAITGIIVGVPIPIVGSVIAALAFGGIGAFVGAWFGEVWKGRSYAQSSRVGEAAFWGRLVGTLSKTLIGTVMAGVAMAAVFV
jgi:uncharacterized protein YqgC (DUF456 family)